MCQHQMQNNASQQTNKWQINVRRRAQRWIFLLVTCLKLEIICAFVHKLGNFLLPAVEIDWKWNDSLWSCVHSSIHPTCWQSTASIKAWRGRNSASRIRIKEEGDDSGRAGGQKEGEMKQNECREMTKEAGRETVLSRPARTGCEENRRSKRT